MTFPGENFPLPGPLPARGSSPETIDPTSSTDTTSEARGKANSSPESSSESETVSQEGAAIIE